MSGKRIDITGKRFTHLLAIKDIGISKRGEYLWQCVCDCGKTTIVPSYDLRSGHSKSCGCHKNRGEDGLGYHSIKLIGRRFNRLLVIGLRNKRNRRHRLVYVCRCDCGKVKEVSTEYLIQGKTQSCGCWNRDVRIERIRKVASAAIGEKNHNWRGGLSFNPYPVDFSKTLKRDIRSRYDNKCFLCGTENINGYALDVHHINYDKNDLRPENLIPLCRTCHGKTGEHREYYQNYFAKTMRTF